MRCSATEASRLPPPDVRKLAQLAQIAVTDEEVRRGWSVECLPPPHPHQTLSGADKVIWLCRIDAGLKTGDKGSMLLFLSFIEQLQV